jgi:formyl-CoA transferase/CoA:oxalate CoA-transferase
VLGLDDLAKRADLALSAGRTENRDEIDAAVTRAIRQRSVAEWCDIFEESDVPHAPILTVGEAVEHPHTIARGMVQSIQHDVYGDMKVVGSPLLRLWMDEADVEPPQMPGESNRKILAQVNSADSRSAGGNGDHR